MNGEGDRRSWTYARIKALARLTGQKVEDLLALTAQNAPFYVGRPAALEHAAWFVNHYDRHGYRQLWEQKGRRRPLWSRGCLSVLGALSSPGGRD